MTPNGKGREWVLLTSVFWALSSATLRLHNREEQGSSLGEFGFLGPEKEQTVFLWSVICQPEAFHSPVPTTSPGGLGLRLEMHENLSRIWTWLR